MTQRCSSLSTSRVRVSQRAHDVSHISHISGVTILFYAGDISHISLGVTRCDCNKGVIPSLTRLHALDGFFRHAEERFPNLAGFVEALGLDGLAKHGALKEFDLPPPRLTNANRRYSRMRFVDYRALTI